MPTASAADINYFNTIMGLREPPKASWLRDTSDEDIVLSVSGRSFLIKLSLDAPALIAEVDTGTPELARSIFMAQSYSSDGISNTPEFPTFPQQGSQGNGSDNEHAENQQALKHSFGESAAASYEDALDDMMLRASTPRPSSLDGAFPFSEVRLHEIAERDRAACLKNSERNIARAKTVDLALTGDERSTEKLLRQIKTENPGMSDFDARQQVNGMLEIGRKTKKAAEAELKKKWETGTLTGGDAPNSHADNEQETTKFPSELKPKSDFSVPVPNVTTPGLGPDAKSDIPKNSGFSIRGVVVDSLGFTPTKPGEKVYGFSVHLLPKK